MDRGEQIDHGKGLQTYGSYPMYLLRENSEKFSDKFHVNYFRNSNAMDIIKSTKNGIHFLTFKTIGGILDFRFFVGDNNPEQTLRPFQEYIGKSVIPPFWSLGFHQSRWGYENVTMLEQVI